MKPKPMNLPDWKVRAFLEGRATEMRLPVKPHPEGGICHGSKLMPSIDGDKPTEQDRQMWHMENVKENWYEPITCPFGEPGQLLWVRETWAETDQAGCSPEDAHVVYKATDPDWETMTGWKWRSPMHMPQWASRLTLETVAVRVERLQRFTIDSLGAEGLDIDDGQGAEDFSYAEHFSIAGVPMGCYNCAEIYAYAAEWDRRHRHPYNWKSNPWVWVGTVKVVKP